MSVEHSAMRRAQYASQHATLLETENARLRQQVSVLVATIHEAMKQIEVSKELNGSDASKTCDGVLQQQPISLATVLEGGEHPMKVDFTAGGEEVTRAGRDSAHMVRDAMDANLQPPPGFGDIPFLTDRALLSGVAPPPGLEAENGFAPPCHQRKFHHAPALSETIVTVVPTPAGGARAEWHVGQLQSKLRASCGFPLVSPPFVINRLPPLRLMFVPGRQWAAKASFTSNRQQLKKKSASANGTSCEPLFGALKLKASGVGGRNTATLCFTLGETRLGPFTCNFAERAVQGGQLLEDWAKDVDLEKDRICLGVEIIA